MKGGDDQDVVLGDNGEIIRELISSVDYPWMNSMVWQSWPAPFDNDPIRRIQRYDDVDYVFGDDVIEGGPGNDILHGSEEMM